MSAATTRRLKTIPSVLAAAVLLLVLLPLWLPVAVLFDAVRLQFRMPTARLLAFALSWAWLETVGVVAAAGLWIVGRSTDHAAHVRLQRWWAARLMDALRTTTGLTIEAADASCLWPGPVVMLCRHASLADSLLSAWVITTAQRMTPRYVLKKELLLDPCLDIVGNRLQNHFLDRQSPDSAAELAKLTELSAGLATDEVAVIFPEGTHASRSKRLRAIERIADRDPQRAARLAPLQHLLPPRPAGSQALLAGCPTADVAIAWHVGFDGLDTFGAILRRLGRSPRPIQFHARRIARADVPAGEPFTAWLDDQWLVADHAVDVLLQLEGTP